MLVLKYSFNCNSAGSPNIKLLMQSSLQKVYLLRTNRESCVSRVHTKRIICHTLDGATVCCSQTIYSECAAHTVSTIFCDHNLKSPILTNVLHVMHPGDMWCGSSKSSAIECSVLDTISRCTHNRLWRDYNTWRACMEKERRHIV